MSRYINVDKEICKINEAISINEQGKKEGSLASYCLRRVAEALEKAPTADVKEVRHGEWRDTTAYCGAFTCSICKEMCVNKYNYCPHCGAKMDGGKE